MGIFQNSYILYFSEAPCALTYEGQLRLTYALLANYMAKCQMISGPYGPIFFLGKVLFLKCFFAEVHYDPCSIIPFRVRTWISLLLQSGLLSRQCHVPLYIDGHVHRYARQIGVVQLGDCFDTDTLRIITNLP